VDYNTLGGKMNIWAQYKNDKPEKIEENVPKKEVNFLVQEYRMAFGDEYCIWAGLQRDAPNKWR
jgi:hypothetical protein